MSSERNLLSLPHVVINEILDHLDLRTLKKLRLLCKQTKGWVEQQKYLRKFQICVSTKRAYKDLTRSTVLWNNFLFPYHIWYETLLHDFVKHFGPKMKHLDLSGVFRRETGTFLNTISPEIQTLRLEECMLIYPENSLRSSSPWSDKFANLKELRIEEIVCTPNKIHDKRKTIQLTQYSFDLILQSCTNNLTFLKLPTIDHDKEVDDQRLFHRFVLNPTLNYLKRCKNSSSQRLVIDLGGIPDQKFPITSEGLFELARICSEIGTQLINVPSHALPNQVTQTDKMILDKSIISIKVLDAGLENIYIPPRSRVDVIVGWGSPEEQNLFSLEHRPNSVDSLHCYNTRYEFVQHLLQFCPPTVQEFKLAVDKHWVGYAVLAEQLCDSFPNLMKLHLESCRINNGYPLLMSRLPLLTHLTLLNCTTLNDESILGTDPHNPLILRLTNLIHLEMSRTRITNLSFKNAFRHMKLKTFKWLFIRDSSKVTFRDGISSLGTIEGGFRDTVEFLELSLPNDCSKSALETFLDCFKNIKSFKACHA